MNISQEFFKIREGFRKVRDDMNFIISKISQNYDEFMSKHTKIAQEVADLSSQVKINLEKIKEKSQESFHNFSNFDILDLKSQIKELKLEISQIEKSHNTIISAIDDIRSNKSEIKNIKEKLHSSELEIYLLKERLLEKDVEIKQIRDISKHLFNIVDELSKTELDLLNLKTDK